MAKISRRNFLLKDTINRHSNTRSCIAVAIREAGFTVIQKGKPISPLCMTEVRLYHWLESLPASLDVN